MRSMLFLRTSTTACGSSMTLASDCCRNHSFLELTPGSIVSLLTSPTRRRGSVYAAPATAGTTVIIVTQAPAYTAPPVASGYYAAAPVVSQPIYIASKGCLSDRFHCKVTGHQISPRARRAYV